MPKGKQYLPRCTLYGTNKHIVQSESISFLWFKIPKQIPVFDAQSPGFGQISSISIGSVNVITAFSFKSWFLFPFIFEIYTISKGETGGECSPIIESLTI